MTRTFEGRHPHTIAVVGSGPVGVYFVNELARLGYTGKVTLFGDEPHAPYNRVQLSSLLDGSIRWEDLISEVDLKPQWQSFYHTQIIGIDRASQCLTDRRGQKYHYDTLVLATGSRPHIPSIPGSNLKGVFAFRNLEDVNHLLSRQVASRHTVVVGGGLLGIETARAMAKYGTLVTLIHHSPILMNRQLDDAASTLLAMELENHGVTVRLSTAVLSISGSHNVEQVTTRGQSPLNCDTVIFATGIKPNLELARDTGIAVGQGIKIDEYLCTSQPNTYAIGECAEFNGRIFGLVAPGLEQAGVLARNLCAGNRNKSYRESLLSASLKVVDTPVFSIGEVGQDYDYDHYTNLVFTTRDTYRKLVLNRGRLVGAIGLGDWPEQDLLKTAVARRLYLNPLRRLFFRFQGSLFSDEMNPARMPPSAIICNCRQVPASAIRDHVQNGCNSVEALANHCGAGTVCGSCRPLLAAFTAQSGFKPPSHKWLAGWGALAGILIAAFFLLPPLAITPTYNPDSLDKWWTETDYRQVSGFTILGLMTVGLLVALRKRLRWFRWLQFDRWRWLHVILSAVCVAILFVHTGLGEIQGLNFWLLISFMAAGAMGIGTAVLTHFESVQPGLANKTFKRWFTTAHLISFWPFPVLLALHILTVYWF
jgi:NAD(P)H-nitrite reductase large subunit